MLAPKGFTQTIDKEAFIEAQLTANKRVGILRFTLPAILFAAILAIGGVMVLFSNGRAVSFLISGIGILCMAGMLAAVFIKLIPDIVKTFANSDYTSYDALSNGAVVTFASDEMSLKSEVMTRRVEYAKTRLCIETAARFVIVTDEDNVVILEKSCFDNTEETASFLRDVFARWYVRV